MHDDCNIVAHVCITREGKFHTLPTFVGLTCFEIAHHPRWTDFSLGSNRKGNIIIEQYYPIWKYRKQKNYIRLDYQEEILGTKLYVQGLASHKLLLRLLNILQNEVKYLVFWQLQVLMHQNSVLFKLLLTNQFIKQGGAKDKRKWRKRNHQESQQESSIMFSHQLENQREQGEKEI